MADSSREAPLQGTSRRQPSSALATASRLLLTALVAIVVDLEVNGIDLVHDAVGYGLGLRAVHHLRRIDPPDSIRGPLALLTSSLVVGIVVALADTIVAEPDRPLVIWGAAFALVGLQLGMARSFLDLCRWTGLDRPRGWWAVDLVLALVVAVVTSVVLLADVAGTGIPVITVAAGILGFVVVLHAIIGLVLTSRAGDAWRTTGHTGDPRVPGDA